MTTPYSPGGDAQPMFAPHGWPERGADMMRMVQTRVVETTGSVAAFERHFAGDLHDH